MASSSRLELANELATKKEQLETLLAHNQHLKEKLATLNQNQERKQVLLDQKRSQLAAKETAIRDGNVVNDKTLRDIETRRRQLEMLENAEANLLNAQMASFESMGQVMDDQMNELEVIAKTLSGMGSEDVAETFDDLKQEIEQLNSDVDGDQGKSAQELESLIDQCLEDVNEAERKLQLLKKSNEKPV